MIHQRLIDARKGKGLSQAKMAKLAAMEQTTYSRKERGSSPINDAEWERFAKALEVPIEDIKDERPLSFKNENCHFNDQSVGIQYVNIPQNVLEVILKYNRKLEEENQELRKNR